MANISKILIVHGGELAKDVAEQLAAKNPANSSTTVEVKCASQRPSALLELGEDTLVCFVLQTVENAAPTEEVRNV